MLSEIAGTSTYCSKLVHANVKENSKVTHYSPFEKWIHRWLVVSPHRVASNLRSFTMSGRMSWLILLSIFDDTKHDLWVASAFNTHHNQWRLIKKKCIIRRELYSQFGYAKIKLHRNDNYDDVIMSAMVSQITSLTIVYSIVYSGANQRKHQSSASPAICAGNSPVTDEFPARKPVRRSFDVFFDLKCFHLMTSSWMKKLSMATME